MAARLKVLGLRPSRAWGQSFLIDPFVADAEAALALPAPGGVATEIGGGLGILTEALLRRAPLRLDVIEKDPRLARHLRATLLGRAEVIEGDALTVEIAADRSVVGNLPFAVATPILVRLFERRTRQVTAMVQREVADRLGAVPGHRAYGRLTILAALYGSVELFQVVPSSAFYPEPEVDGRLLVHRARPGALPVDDVPRFEAMLRRLFSSRRKQLGNLLPKLKSISGAPETWARDAGWPADWARRRPEELSPAEYFRLAEATAA